jgi:arylsulfatase A-like enzyme
MFARGYFPGRSGQVFYVPRQGDFLVDKDPLYQFMHGSPWPYDTAIPLIFHGRRFVRPGRYDMPAVQQDVAPTLAALLHVSMPPTATGRVLEGALTGTTGRPRVIVLFVLDGMRVDYFDKYGDLVPTLSRLRREGAWFERMRANALPTATSLGHATIGTGADPRVHGLVVNRLFNRVSGSAQESYNNLDPGELMALTLADVWNIATDGKAHIIAQGGAIRAAAGLVGHGACLVNGHRVMAASYSTRNRGEWETNEECYTMPAVLKGMTPEPYWTKAQGRWMGHDIASPGAFRSSAVFQRFEGDALAAVLESSPIGSDDVTDLVLVNTKGPDYVGHAYGPDSAEIRDLMAELDRQIARALEIVEKKAGADNTVVAVTADHGMPAEPPVQGRRIMPAEVAAALNQRFSPTPPVVVQFFSDAANAQVHLDTGRLQQLGFSLDDVARFLEERYFLVAFTEDEVRAASRRLPLGQ